MPSIHARPRRPVNECQQCSLLLLQQALVAILVASLVAVAVVDQVVERWKAVDLDVLTQVVLRSFLLQ